MKLELNEKEAELLATVLHAAADTFDFDNEQERNIIRHIAHELEVRQEIEK